jgi:putative transposase
MDEAHLIAAVRYVSLNPVRAGLARNADDWAWSSVQAHRAGVDDGLVTVRPVLDRVDDLVALLNVDPEAEDPYAGQVQALRASERTGRPLGARDFVDDLERRLGRTLARRGAGRRSSSVAPEQATLL